MFIEANGDRAERLEPFLAIDAQAERELFEWLIARQRPEGTVTSADAWRICGCEGVASEFGFEHSRTFVRLDRETLADLNSSPFPADLRVIGPADAQANMAGWAAVYNEAFAGELRLSPQLDIGMHGFVLMADHLSMAAIDEAGNTVALALVRLENRPHDYLRQPVGNVWVLCTTTNRRREGVGKGLLRAVLINLRMAGAMSATIQSDLDSRFRSYTLYERVGFKQAVRFCIRSRRF